MLYVCAYNIRKRGNDMTTLNKLPLNSSGEIISLGFSGNLRRRFLDLGFTIGSKVYSAFKSPCGDPVAYIVRGTVIALRNADAKQIIIK